MFLLPKFERISSTKSMSASQWQSWNSNPHGVVLEDEIAPLLSYPRPVMPESLRMGLTHQDVLEAAEVILWYDQATTG